MALTDLQPAAMADLDAAYARAVAVVDPYYVFLAEARIEAMLTGVPSSVVLVTTQDLEISELVDQMLIDVSNVDDRMVKLASRYFENDGLADFVMASYIIEARTRLRIASDRLGI